MSWAVMGWAGIGWACMGCVGLGWHGLGCHGLGWHGMSWHGHRLAWEWARPSQPILLRLLLLLPLLRLLLLLHNGVAGRCVLIEGGEGLRLLLSALKKNHYFQFTSHFDLVFTFESNFEVARFPVN